MQSWRMIPALLDIRPSLVPVSSNPTSLVVAGILLSLALIFVGRMFWKRSKKS
jgi:hypothetical protein